MQLTTGIKKKIDNFFDNISSEELFILAIEKYGLKEIISNEIDDIKGIKMEFIEKENIFEVYKGVFIMKCANEEKYTISTGQLITEKFNLVDIKKIIDKSILDISETMSNRQLLFILNYTNNIGNEIPEFKGDIHHKVKIYFYNSVKKYGINTLELCNNVKAVEKIIDELYEDFIDKTSVEKQEENFDKVFLHGINKFRETFKDNTYDMIRAFQNMKH